MLTEIAMVVDRSGGTKRDMTYTAAQRKRQEEANKS